VWLVFVVTGGLVLLHAVQALVGHGAFVIAGPAVGGALTVAVWRLALRGRVAAPVATKLASALLVLLVLPEWLEGELVVGHEVTFSTMLGHALPSTITVLLALLVLVASEARRTLALLRDAFG